MYALYIPIFPMQRIPLKLKLLVHWHVLETHSASRKSTHWILSRHDWPWPTSMQIIHIPSKYKGNTNCECFFLRIHLENLRKSINTLSKTVSKASDVQNRYCPSRSRKFMLAMLPDFTNITFLPITAWTDFDHKVTIQVIGSVCWKCMQCWL
jgi:hypothetical protein